MWYDLADPKKQRVTIAVNSYNAALAFSACGRKVMYSGEEGLLVEVYNVDCDTCDHFKE